MTRTQVLNGDLSPYYAIMNVNDTICIAGVDPNLYNVNAFANDNPDNPLLGGPGVSSAYNSYPTKLFWFKGKKYLGSESPPYLSVQTPGENTWTGILSLNGKVTDVRQYDSTHLLVVGYFTSADGKQCTHVLKYNPQDGTVDTVTNSLQQNVGYSFVDPIRGKLYLGLPGNQNEDKNLKCWDMFNNCRDTAFENSEPENFSVCGLTMLNGDLIVAWLPYDTHYAQWSIETWKVSPDNVWSYTNSQGMTGAAVTGLDTVTISGTRYVIALGGAYFNGSMYYTTKYNGYSWSTFSIGAFTAITAASDGSIYGIGSGICKFTFSYTGISNVTANEDVKAFPTNFNDNITITGCKSGDVIKICNMLGQTLTTQKASGSEMTIDGKTFPSGIYLLAIEGNTSKKVIRLLKT